mmetsp:Transcript_25205/g.63514  ORF Transcript_25205/g.63514 Transcript_25205/m.63514 type:complete len:138 (-) Transcript_25205:140-553(-)
MFGLGDLASDSFIRQDLRKMAASYMRTHPDDYMPFVIEDCDDPSAEFEKYCSDVEDTATWGGQVEIDALAHVLERHIAVYSTDLGCLNMGEKFQGTAPSLRVCYHRHAYGMGEHYNSVVDAAADVMISGRSDDSRQS